MQKNTFQSINEREVCYEKREECVSRSKRLEMLREGYDTATVGYLGRRKMYKALRQGFY
jgi:hypothetical protein